MASLRDLVSPVTADAIRTSIYSVLTGLGLNPTAWKAGDPEAAIVWGVSSVTAELWNSYGTPAIASGFLDYATGKWLKSRASQGYGVEFIPAAFAAGEWTGTNSTGATLGPYAPGDLVFVHTTKGKTYRNTETVSFLAGVPLVIDIEANEVGTDSDAAPGTIELQTVVLGLSGTNAVSVLGQDDEEDADLRARCRLKLGALSPNGSRSAYEYVALTPTDPSGRWDHGVTVIKTKVSPTSETAEVEVLLAGPDGALTAPEVTAVDLAIQTTVVPEAVTCTVASATALLVPVTFEVFLPTGLSDEEVETLVGDALSDLFRDLKIGGSVLPSGPTGYVFRNVIEAAILRAVPGALQVEVTAPAADVALDAAEVAVLSTVTPTITRTTS